MVNGDGPRRRQQGQDGATPLVGVAVVCFLATGIVELAHGLVLEASPWLFASLGSVPVLAAAEHNVRLV